MIDVIVDSSVWIDAERGIDSTEATQLRSLVRAGAIIGVTDVIYAELRTGTIASRSLDVLVRDGLVARLRDLDDFERAASCMRATIETGTRIRAMADCLIASVCIRERLPLLHRDRDFDVLARCTDLQVLAP
jgi:predicted nucleic acid-binding protein